MDRPLSISSSPSSPSPTACSDFSVDVISSITASLDLNSTDSTFAASLSHSSSEADTKIYKRVRWSDGTNEQIERTPEINDWIRRKYRERRATKRHARLPTRLEAQLRAVRMAVRTQEYLRRQRIKLLEAGLKRPGFEAIYEESDDYRAPRLLKATARECN